MDHFISVLKDDIRVVKELPDEYSWSTREYYATAVRATRIKTAPVHASANWYLENVLPVLQRLVHPLNFFFENFSNKFIFYCHRTLLTVVFAQYIISSLCF